MIQTTYYKCDPEKNKECSKRGCALVTRRGRKTGECCVTTNAECAVLNEEGRPVVAYVEMRGDDDGSD